MFKKWVLVVLFMFFPALGNAVEEMYIQFEIESVSELEALTRVIAIDQVIDGSTVIANVIPSELVHLRALGYTDYTILPNYGKPVTPPRMSATLREWDSYPTYDAYLEMMQQFAIDYPELCLLDTLGYSTQGRQLLAVKITDNIHTEEDEPEFFYTSTMHGDETTGYVLMLRFIDYLLTHYGEDERVTHLVDNVEIWINPLANPDGAYYAGNDNIFGAIRRNANGVDLNRNFPDPDDGPHPDGREWQPENLAMMAFAARQNITMSANFHGGAEVVNYPWDTYSWESADDDWWQLVCHEYADAAQENSPPGYMDGFDDGIVRGYVWYPIAGGRQDYMIYYHGGRECTIELSNIKLLPENQLDAHWEYNQESFLLYLEQVLYGIRGIVTNPAGEPVAATVTVLNHDEDSVWVYTDPDVGDYHRVIHAGTYDVQFTAEGYLPYLVEDVEINDYETVRIDVVMQPIPRYTLRGTVVDGETDQPLAGVEVFILELPENQTITGENGVFQFDDLMSGDYTLRLYAEQYASVTQQVTLEEDIDLDIALYPSFTESFEGGEFPPEWEFHGNAPWEIDNIAADGSFSARSGRISSYQRSQMWITLDINHPGEIVFQYKTSTEIGDKLEFYIDNVRQGSWSGEIDWTEARFPVSTGSHIFKWSYQKNASGSGGEDAVWVDVIIFPPTPTGGDAPEITLSPAEFDLTLPPNFVGQGHLDVFNTGSRDLQVLAELPEVDWLNLDPVSGTVRPDEMLRLHLNFNLIGIDLGTELNTTITLYSNDPDTPEIHVPVNVLVDEFTAATYPAAIHLPATSELGRNYPNPFNPQTVIPYAIAHAGQVTLMIYDLHGHLVQVLVDAVQPAGYYTVMWDASARVSGLYICRLEVDNLPVDTTSLLLLK